MNGILYVPTAPTSLLNVTADLSWQQGKNHHCTTEDGHALAYIGDVTVITRSSDPTFTNEIFIQTVPNTWRMRNSVRKFHFARSEMFKRAGVSKKEMGRYGRTMRPLFDLAHATEYAASGTDNRLLPFQYHQYDPATRPEGAEWTYTQLANMVPQKEGDTTPTGSFSLMPALVDEWWLQVLDVSTGSGVAGATNQSFTNVGMIHAYNQDRQNVVSADSDLAETIQNNPLASLTAQVGSTGAIMEIAEGQEEERPPYDQRHEGHSIAAEFAGISQSTASIQSVTFRNVIMPLGYVDVNSGEIPSRIFVEVTGMAECRALE